MVSLYKRKNKKFPDTFYVSWYEAKKKKSKAIGPYKAAAEAFKREVEEKLSYRKAGIEQPTKEIPLEDAIEKYLEYSKANKANQTFLLDEYALEKLFLSFLKTKGISSMQGIFPEVLEDFKADRLKTVEKATHNREITSIKAFFNTMVRWRYLRESPAKHLKKLRLPVQMPRFLTKDEIKALLKAADEQTKPIIEVFLYTGLRRNELRFLRWQDVDMENKRVLVQNKEGFHTKSYQPRVIPMHPRLFQIFRKLAKKKKGLYVFPNVRGESRAHLSREIKSVIDTAGLENVSTHTLRHTFASHLSMKGVPIRTIQILMGHADIRMTMIYAHLSPEHLQGAVEKLGF